MTEHVCAIRELVDGHAAVPAQELAPTLTDPDTGEVLHGQRASAPDSVERALATAASVHEQEIWTGLPLGDRAAALRTLQAELTARVEQLAGADSLDSGVPYAVTSAFIRAVAQILEAGAAQLEEGFGHAEQETSAGPCDQWRLPWGPAVVLLPWNAPTHMAMVRTADALVAGCPVILKPSEWSPHSSGPFADAVQAALPPGVVQIIQGDRVVSEALVEDARTAVVSFTGGVPGGKGVAEACARQLKPVDLELSGNNPVVVLPDAEPAEVATQVVLAMLTLNGQYCVGPRRLIVPEDKVEDYLTAFGTVLESVTIGATTDPTTQLGPLSHEPHLRRLEAQLAEFESRGCEVRRFGKLPGGAGHFLAPTVVLADKAADLREEVFGPVLQVRSYRTLDEAVAIANDHPYGLSGYVFGADRALARMVGRRLRAGLVRLNSAYGPPDSSPVASVWGVSGIGQFGSGLGAQFFSGARFVG
ncbi:aldehyde dehydrogenase family protein [Sphaerisporangium sp. NPDC051017]|uniref:aldehyde dehydrogenase family protein n=1 Tax=Sphaerisporangium sp. NPDC051017 TaxID=3154636 RepID=UPI00341A7090